MPSAKGFDIAEQDNSTEKEEKKFPGEEDSKIFLDLPLIPDDVIVNAVLAARPKPSSTESK